MIINSIIKLEIMIPRLYKTCFLNKYSILIFLYIFFLYCRISNISYIKKINYKLYEN